MIEHRFKLIYSFFISNKELDSAWVVIILDDNDDDEDLKYSFTIENRTRKFES